MAEMYDLRYAIPVAYTGAELLARQHRGEFGLWPHNRAVNMGRVDQIARSMEETQDPWYLGPVPVYVAYVENRGYILDGQHRLAALAKVDDPGLFRLFLGRIYARQADELQPTLPLEGSAMSQVAEELGGAAELDARALQAGAAARRSDLESDHVRGGAAVAIPDAGMS